MQKGGTSKGNQIKYFENGYFIKIDSPGWYESISEILVSELQCSIVTPLPFVDYTWERYEGFPACRCKSFLLKDESVVSLYSLLKQTGYSIDYNGSGEYLRDTICGILQMEYNVDAYDYFSYLVYLDAITLNEDRHLRNISFIKSGSRLRPAPVYDNGLSLLSDKNAYPKGIEDVDRVKSQPFSLDFGEQVRLFDNPGIKIKYDTLLNRLNLAESNPGLCVDGRSCEDLVRAIGVLKYQLEKTEGLLWTKV